MIVDNTLNRLSRNRQAEKDYEEMQKPNGIKRLLLYGTPVRNNCRKETGAETILREMYLDCDD